MNKWDRVEKQKRVATHRDVQMLYVQMALWILGGLAYFYFVVMGWHL